MLTRTVCLALLVAASPPALLIARPSGAQQATMQLALDAYFSNRMDSAIVLFQRATRENPTDARGYAWLAEAALRSGSSAEARKAADAALRIDACNAQAHWVRASLFTPRFAPSGQVNNDSTWTHLTAAVTCDPTDGNAWSDVWKYAIMRGDTVMESRALSAHVKTGFLTPAQVTYAEWLLRSLPPRAVLLTGGDLDTYGPLAVQVARGVRPDVAVVNIVMLSAPWYSRPVLARHQLKYDPTSVTDSAGTDQQRIVRWLRRSAITGVLDRPVAFALSAPVDTVSRDGALQLAGPYWLVVRPTTVRINPTAVAESLSSASSMDWRGPGAALSDRSPIRRLLQPPPALMVSRLAVLEHALVERDDKLTQDREQWVSAFLSRAGLDPTLIGRELELFRSSRARRTPPP
jgi:hypothetical protein